MGKSTTHIDGILVSLYILGGNKKPIDSETLTVGCFKAFPSLFSMDLFKEYPRIDRVKNRIKDLMHLGLVEEKGEGQYQMTEKGIGVVQKNSELLRRISSLIPSNVEFISYQNMSSEEIEKETKKLQRTEAYKKFIEDKLKTLTIADFMDFMKIDVYATKQLFDRKVKRIAALCKTDENLEKLFNIMSEKFGKDYTLFKSEIDKLIGGLKK